MRRFAPLALTLLALGLTACTTKDEVVVGSSVTTPTLGAPSIGPRPGALDAPASAVVAPAKATGKTWFVDCSAAAGGDGSFAAPLADLAAASALALRPGDQLLLRRGVTCHGMLEPHGDGTAAAPIVIGGYAVKDKPVGTRPVIAGDGTVTAAVHLADLSYVTVEELEVTNSGGDDTQPKRGVYVTAADGAVSTGITVRGLDVHTVTGPHDFSDNAKSGGGIIAAASGTGRIDDLLVERNAVHDVARSGIYLIAASVDLDQRTPATSDWPAAGTNVVVQGNLVERPAGDGIVALGTLGATIQDNVVRDGNLYGRDFTSADRDCAAGIWAWNANRTLIQYNEVSGMHYGSSPTDGCDGTGYDADGHQDGTVIQFNYSHDNEGGFLLICTESTRHTVDVRFNLSVDDAHTFSPAPCSGDIDSTQWNLTGVRLFNNTFVSASPSVTLEGNEALGAFAATFLGDFQFVNNIVYGTSPTAADHFFACGSRCTNNLFFNLPAYGTGAVTSDPLFVDPNGRGGGEQVAAALALRPGSPAIGAGVTLENATATDSFGRPVPSPPSLGFAQPAA